MTEYLAICPQGHRSYLRLEGIAIPALGIEADPEIKGVCTTCGQPADLTPQLADPPFPDHRLPGNLKDALAEVERLRKNLQDAYRVTGKLREQRQTAEAEVERLRAEVEDLGRALASGIEAARDEANEAERRLELLGRLEWAGEDVGSGPRCLVCGASRDHHYLYYDDPGEHRPRCWLAAELRPAASPAGGDPPAGA
jgi:hypothetical protein